MPRIRIRDFSGGLNTNQSELDLQDNEFTVFTNIKNKKPGRLEKPKGQTNVSSDSSSGNASYQMDFAIYRTEKNASDADTSTTWFIFGNRTFLAIHDTSTGTGGSWTTLTTGFSSNPIYDFLTHNQVLRIGDGSFTNNSKWYAHIKRDIFGQNLGIGDDTTVPRYAIVHHNQTLDDWYMQDAAITAPTAVKMSMAHDGAVTVAGCSYNNGRAITTSNSTLGLTLNMVVEGSGIPANSYITVITSDTVFEISANTTGGSKTNETLTFTSLKDNTDVGLFVYEPRHKYDDDDTENDEHNAWINAMDNDTFDPADRYALTYIYDYVQESSLSLNRDGEIGVSGFEVEKGADDESDSGTTLLNAMTEDGGVVDVASGTGSLFQLYTYIKVDSEVVFIRGILSDRLYVRRAQLGTEGKEHPAGVPIYYRSSPQKGRAINVVLNGLSSSGYHNPRITGLNVYWQPKGDVDWYLVESLDINKGYSESILANTPNNLVPGSSNLSPVYASNNYNNFAMTNYGYFVPCPNYIAVDDVTKNADGSSTQFSFDTTSWTGSTNNFQDTAAVGATNYIAILSRREANDSSDLATQFNRLGAYYTSIANIDTSDSKINFKKYNNVNRVQAQHTAAYSNVSKPNRISTHFKHQTKVTTWYIPYDGLKLATYSSLTGRASKTKLASIKWNTSAVLNNRGYYADIDTVDENEQTAREKNRIYFTDPFKLDEILPGRYLTVGVNDGDEIIKLMSYRDRLFVFKSRNTYVYNKSHQLERVFVGVGATHKHSVCETPLGLVCANQNAIYAVNVNNVKELSFKIKDSWQALTLAKPKIGYDGIDNELIVVNDETDGSAWVMNLDNGSWHRSSITATDRISNFAVSNGLRAQYIDNNDGDITATQLNTGSAVSTTSTVTSKRFDFGSPDTQKRINKITLMYKASSNVTVKIYVDGSGSADTTLTFGTQSTVNSTSLACASLGKTMTIEVACDASNLEIDSMDIDYQILGSNP